MECLFIFLWEDQQIQVEDPENGCTDPGLAMDGVSSKDVGLLYRLDLRSGTVETALPSHPSDWADSYTMVEEFLEGVLEAVYVPLV
jgi:hypothetical protein